MVRETAVSEGTLIDGTFEVVKQLGAGGMASVYLANHLTMHQLIAIKLLHHENAQDSDAVLRFQREAVAIAKLDQENTVKIFKTGVWQERPYIAMEYLEGESLDKILKQGPMQVEAVRRLCNEISAALHNAHQNGIIHRDVKPSNIIVLESNGSAKLTDFGIAKMITGDQSLTSTGQLLGTPSYMSPEQLANQKIDLRSDIYSLACVIYEALSGAAPFASDNALQVAQAHLSQPPKPLPSLSNAVNQVLLGALSKNRDERPSSCAEFAKLFAAATLKQPRQSGKAPLLRSSYIIAALIGAVSIIAFSSQFLGPNKKTKALADEEQLSQAASSTKDVNEKLQLIYKEVKEAQKDVDKAKPLAIAYSLQKRYGIKTNDSNSRAINFFLLSEYADLLNMNSLPNSALKAYEQLESEIEKHGMPSMASKALRFSEADLTEGRSKMLGLLLRRGSLEKAQRIYASLNASGNNTAAMLRAAIMMNDKAVISRIASGKHSKATTVKIALILLEHGLSKELRSCIDQAQEHRERFVDASWYQIEVITAKLELTENDVQKAAELASKCADKVLNSSLPQERKEKLLGSCIEILSVAESFPEALKYIRAGKLDASLAKAPEAGKKIQLIDIDRIIRSGNLSKSQPILDAYLEEEKTRNETKALAASWRGEVSEKDAVKTYYSSIATALLKKSPRILKELKIRILVDQLRKLKNMDLLELSEKEATALLNSNAYDQLGYPYNTYLQFAAATKLMILRAMNREEELKTCYLQLQKNIPVQTDIHVFFNEDLANNNIKDASELIKNCQSEFELVMCVRNCLDRKPKAQDLIDACIARMKALPARNETEEQYKKGCIALVTAETALEQGNKQEAWRASEGALNAGIQLESKDFQKNMKVYNQLSDPSISSN